MTIRSFSSRVALCMLAAMLCTVVVAGEKALACTGLRLTAKDGSVVVGRTLEFGQDIQTKVIVVPAGTPMSGTLPNNEKGIQYTTKYGFVGANAFGLPIVVDGVNDQGLYVGLFFFPGYAQFTPVTADTASRAMGGYQYGAWILGNFSTVAQFKAAYNNVVLAPTVVAQMGGAPPVHFRVVDKTGAAVVVEPIKGKLVIYDDPLGVLTNSPAFDWHMTNLSQYVGLRAQADKPLTTGGVTLSAFGQGSGFMGIPGDFTPPSRFVRMVAFQQTAVPSSTGVDAVQQAFHLLNNFDIPVGAVRDVVDGQTIDEWTLWTSAEDLNSLTFYYRTYNDQTIRSVDVKRALAASAGRISQLPLETTSTTPIVPVALKP